MPLPTALRAALLAIPLTLLYGPQAEAGDPGWRHRHVLLQFEFGEYRYPEPAWAAGGISCRGGARIVRNRGFRHVHPLDCSGRTFSYMGLWRGESFQVFVDSAAGRIIGVGPS